MHGTMKGAIYTKFEKEADKLRMVPGGAWTINIDEIDFDEVRLIRYKTERYIYTIYPEDALAAGFLREFQNEDKLIVPLKHWIKEKRR